MDELIFFGVIIAFSILDSILRGAKKKAQKTGTDGLPVPEPEPWAEPEWEDDLPTYDSEPSYDDAVRSGPDREWQEESQRSEPAPSSSEGLIPKDIWEEIAAMAGGRLPIEPAPEPEPVEIEPKQPEPMTTLSGRALPVRRGQTSPSTHGSHRVHLAHAGYGTDPSERAPSEQDGMDPLAETLGQDAKAARGFLVSKDAHALRQAIILQELLGPPAAFREWPH